MRDMANHKDQGLHSTLFRATAENARYQKQIIVIVIIEGGITLS